jgi:hypothetical protein
MLPPRFFLRVPFPIGPDDLIQKGKEVLGPDIGLGTGDDGECLADNFQLCASVVGPLRKEEYVPKGSWNLQIG